MFPVQFYPWFKFYFPLFLGMVMYDNEFETKENKIKPRIKLNHNIHRNKLVLVSIYVLFSVAGTT